MRSRFPSGYLHLRVAHNQLTGLYQGSQPPDPETGLPVVDSVCAAAAAQDLRPAILNQDLELYALLSSATPTRLADQDLIEAALFSTKEVMTFYRIESHRKSFGLSGRDLKKLARDPLCLDEKAFRAWLKKQAAKRARTHKAPGEAWKSPGRPGEKRQHAVEALEQLDAKGKLRPEMSNPQLHALMKRTHPSLKMAVDTLRRARQQFCARKISPKTRSA